MIYADGRQRLNLSCDPNDMSTWLMVCVAVIFCQFLMAMGFVVFIGWSINYRDKYANLRYHKEVTTTLNAIMDAPESERKEKLLDECVETVIRTSESRSFDPESSLGKKEEIQKHFLKWEKKFTKEELRKISSKLISKKNRKLVEDASLV